MDDDDNAAADDPEGGFWRGAPRTGLRFWDVFAGSWAVLDALAPVPPAGATTGIAPPVPTGPYRTDQPVFFTFVLYDRRPQYLRVLGPALTPGLPSERFDVRTMA